VEARDLGLQAGDVCLVRPGEIHQLRPLPTLEPFDTLWWHVTAGGVNLTLAGFAGERRKTRAGFVPLTPNPVPAVSRVVQELEGARPRRELLIRTALLDLAARILRHLDETQTRPSPVFTGERKGSWHVQRVAQYIEAHYGAGVTLDRLAEIAGLSPYYLTRLFARYTGRGVMTFLGDVRHREALSLLRRSDLAVSEIGRTVGYDDPYYFSRVFRAREGCAPLHYRQRFQNASDSSAF
jgi:AraC-like DNA-binding protein